MIYLEQCLLFLKSPSLPLSFPAPPLPCPRQFYTMKILCCATFNHSFSCLLEKLVTALEGQYCFGHLPFTALSILQCHTHPEEVENASFFQDQSDPELNIQQVAKALF